MKELTEIDAFERDFNAARGSVRVVTVLSPT